MLGFSSATTSTFLATLQHRLRIRRVSMCDIGRRRFSRNNATAPSKRVFFDAAVNVLATATAIAVCFHPFSDRRFLQMRAGEVGCGGESISQALFLAARNNRSSEIKNILKHSTASSPHSPNQRHDFGWTLLHVACINGSIDAARELLECGADPNIAEVRPLHWTPQMNPLMSIIRHQEFSPLLRANADTLGFTPLHYAVIIGSEELIQLLLRHGADPTVKDSGGRMAEAYFDENKQDAKILESLHHGHQQFQALKLRKEKEHRKKFPLEKILKETLVGQDGPIMAVASAIRRKENGWNDEERPLVFLFLGSSGVGKTELAKQVSRHVAKYLSKGNKDSFIRIDMSEFQTKHEVAKFIGSPPGYIGHEKGGGLTERLKKHPHAVVLLDEVEKAHIDVLTIMLQVFDEGRLTDGKGETVDCRQAIFVMTSNLAQEEIARNASLIREEANSQTAFSSIDSRSGNFMCDSIYPILRAHFKRDEFLGRINETILFVPFSREELTQVTEHELRLWANRAKSKHQIELTWSEEVVATLADLYNPHYGVRSIKNEVEKRVVNLVARAHEMDEIKEGGRVGVTLSADGSITIQCLNPVPKSPSKKSFLFGS